jgi:hypothetical protein
MAAEINGTFSVIERVSRVAVLVDVGSTCEYAGTISTSSNARASSTREDVMRGESGIVCEGVSNAMGGEPFRYLGGPT